MTVPRLDLDALDADELLRRGIAAARVGESGEAIACLTAVTQRDPDNVDAWLWLAGVETNPQVKRDDFERVLAIQPGHREATDGLARLAEKYGQGVLEHGSDAGMRACYWHPDRQTGLSCTRCGKPICPECARQHPVGWRCKACAKELRSPLYKVSPADYAKAAVGGTLVSCGAAALMGLAGWIWFLAIIVAPGAGTFVADLTSRLAGRKRGRGMQALAAGVVVTGAVIVHWLLALGPLRGLVPYFPIGNLMYALLGAGAAFYRLR
jgi:hypothetical protein